VAGGYVWINDEDAASLTSYEMYSLAEDQWTYLPGFSQREE